MELDYIMKAITKLDDSQRQGLVGLLSAKKLPGLEAAPVDSLQDGLLQGMATSSIGESRDIEESHVSVGGLGAQPFGRNPSKLGPAAGSA